MAHIDIALLAVSYVSSYIWILFSQTPFCNAVKNSLKLISNVIEYNCLLSYSTLQVDSSINTVLEINEFNTLSTLTTSYGITNMAFWQQCILESINSHLRQHKLCNIVVGGSNVHLIPSIPFTRFRFIVVMVSRARVLLFWMPGKQREWLHARLIRKWSDDGDDVLPWNVTNNATVLWLLSPYFWPIRAMLWTVHSAADPGERGHAPFGL